MSDDDRPVVTSADSVHDMLCQHDWTWVDRREAFVCLRCGTWDDE